MIDMTLDEIAAAVSGRLIPSEGTDGSTVVGGLVDTDSREIRPGGNPFEAPRSAEYPLPPLPQGSAAHRFKATAEAMGLHPFPRPGGNASRAYVNEYGMQLGPCTYCGFCEW